LNLFKHLTPLSKTQSRKNKEVLPFMATDGHAFTADSFILLMFEFIQTSHSYVFTAI
jgi:hypothetical protein